MKRLLMTLLVVGLVTSWSFAEETTMAGNKEINKTTEKTQPAKKGKRKLIRKKKVNRPGKAQENATRNSQQKRFTQEANTQNIGSNVVGNNEIQAQGTSVNKEVRQDINAVRRDSR